MARIKRSTLRRVRAAMMLLCLAGSGAVFAGGEMPAAVLAEEPAGSTSNMSGPGAGKVLPDSLEATDRHHATQRSAQNPTPRTTGKSVRGTTWGTGVWATGTAGLALPTVFRAGGGATYAIPGLDMDLESRLLVFNAEGHRVYLQRGYQNGWDGTDRQGKPLPEGRYFLIVEIDGMGDDIQAYIDLKR